MLSQRNVNAVNDLPDHRMPGYLFLGVQNDGTIDGLKVDDALMKRISAIRSDGNILPLPVMSTEKVVTEKGAASLPTFDTRPCREAKSEDIDIDTTAFSVVVRDPGDVNLLQSCHELASNLSPQAKSLSPPSRRAPPTTTTPTQPTPWAPCTARKGRC